jgi:MFS family permease
VFFFGALELEQVRGLSPLETGVAFLPMTLTIAALSLGPVARTIGRFGPRPVLIGGICTSIVGLTLFATLPSDVPYAPLLLTAFVVMGLGGGSTFVPLLTIAMTDVPSRDAGIASGLMNVSMQLGAALGLALLGALAEQRTATQLADGVAHATAQLSGYHLAFALGAGTAVVGLVLTLLMLKSPTPRAEPAEADAELQPA